MKNDNLKQNAARIGKAISAYLPIALAVFSVVELISILSSIIKINEAVWTIISVAGAALFGGMSYYIARMAKKLRSHPRIFISYSRKDVEFARSISETLMKRGARVWLDEINLKPGDNLHAAINSAIESSNSVVAIISGQVGSHVSNELRSAITKNVPIIAVMAPDQEAPEMLNARNTTFVASNDSLAITNAALAVR